MKFKKKKLPVFTSKRGRPKSLKNTKGKMKIYEYLARRENILQDLIVFSQRANINIFIAFDDSSKSRFYTMNCGDPEFLSSIESYPQVIEIPSVSISFNKTPENFNVPLSSLDCFNDAFKLKIINDIRNLKNGNQNLKLEIEKFKNDDIWKIENDDIETTLVSDQIIPNCSKNIKPKFAFPLDSKLKEESSEDSQTFLEEFFFNKEAPAKKISKRKIAKNTEKKKKKADIKVEIKEEEEEKSFGEEEKIQNPFNNIEEMFELRDRNIYQGWNPTLSNSGFNYTMPNNTVNLFPLPSNYSYTMPTFNKYSSLNNFDQNMNAPNFFMNPYFESSRGNARCPLNSKSYFSFDRNEMNGKK